jgi:hypothetical protein
MRANFNEKKQSVEGRERGVRKSQEESQKEEMKKETNSKRKACMRQVQRRANDIESEQRQERLTLSQQSRKSERSKMLVTSREKAK